MAQKTSFVSLPAFLAPALINGDFTGLAEEDEKWFQVAAEYVAPGRIVSASDDEYFAWVCDLPGFNKGCTMLDYTVLCPDLWESLK